MIADANPKRDPLIERAEALYASRWKAKLESAYTDFFVAIEPDAERYFLGKTMREALAAAAQALPIRMTYVMRIGHPAAIRIGAFPG